MKEPQGMTPRERIKNAMDFKKVDIIPWMEAFYEETLLRFLAEGLSVNDTIHGIR